MSSASGERSRPDLAAGFPRLRGPAVVTGAGRGIGRAVAIRLAELGAPVCLSARSGDELEGTAREIEAAGGEAIVLPCDLTSDDGPERMIEAAASALGGIGILVNNAGGAHRVAGLEDLQRRDFDLGTSLNYTAIYRTMHAAAPHLFAAAPGAAVLNVVSIAAEQGLPGISYYSGAKAGVAGLSRAVAREWGPKGVRVNCLGPGWIETELSRPLRESEEFTRETLGRVALGRWGDPAEVAEVAAFLVSEGASYVTGATISVDGGFLA